MIAADTSSIIAFFEGTNGADVELVSEALSHKHLVLPPVVLTELISDPKLPPELAQALAEIPTVDLETGFWERAGRSRAKVIARGHKARIADALIAQTCIDAQLLLITRDKDFRHFAKLCGLRIMG